MEQQGNQVPLGNQDPKVLWVLKVLQVQKEILDLLDLQEHLETLDLLVHEEILDCLVLQAVQEIQDSLDQKVQLEIKAHQEVQDLLALQEQQEQQVCTNIVLIVNRTLGFTCGFGNYLNFF